MRNVVRVSTANRSGNSPPGAGFSRRGLGTGNTGEPTRRAGSGVRADHSSPWGRKGSPVGSAGCYRTRAPEVARELGVPANALYVARHRGSRVACGKSCPTNSALPRGGLRRQPDSSGSTSPPASTTIRKVKDPRVILGGRAVAPARSACTPRSRWAPAVSTAGLAARPDRDTWSGFSSGKTPPDVLPGLAA